MSHLHDKYVIVPADKGPNNIVFVCKWHYIDCLIKKLGIDNRLGNPTYTPMSLTKEDNHRSVLCSFGISIKRKNWIFHHSPGFLNYTIVLTNSCILLGLPNAPRNLFLNYYIISVVNTGL
jgi:hypothetical protein